MSAKQELKDHLEPELGPARLARNRSAIERRLAEGWLFRHRFEVGFATTLLGAATVALLAWPTAEAPVVAAHPVWTVTPDARFAASEAPTTIALDDGSTIDLDPHSSVRGMTRTRSEVEVELEHGAATFDVAHVEGRSFRVASGDVVVRVLGTRFTVTRSAGHVVVDVERGRVEVAHDGETTVLGPGESFRGEEWMAAAPSAPAAEVTEEVEPVIVPSSTDRGPSRDEPMGEEAARTLFEAARAARREGRPDRAAALFAELMEQHPGDPRAGLAAFELGRIRNDVLHDVRGSIEALERALDLSPGGGFRQDALARLVVLYDRLGDQARCREAQSRYLADFRDGPHAADVSAHCE